MAPSAFMLASLLLLAAAAGPAAGSRPRVLERQLQQAGSPESSGANGAESKPEPIGVIQGPTYGAAASGGAAAPSAETPSSPYRFADVGSGSAADVQAATAAGNADGLAAAAAAAGPEAAGRAVADAIRKGSGPALARVVNEGSGAASDAFLTGLWPTMCIDPPAASQTVAAAIEAGGAAARAAAEAATVGARQCCGSTLVTLSQAAAAAPSFVKALGDELKASGISLPDCAAPMGLDKELGITDASAHATSAPGEPLEQTPASRAIGALALGVAPLPEAPPAAIAAPIVASAPAAEASQPLAAPEYSASGGGGGR